ncbi:MAG: sortase [Blastochloris sp.]|nr:sortase [Blastochloris sp.]
MTPKSVESIYCRAEMEYAIALNKPIVPLMVRGHATVEPSPVHRGKSVSRPAAFCRQAVVSELRIDPSCRRSPHCSVPSAPHPAAGSTIRRIVLPAIGLDAKTIEVGWDVHMQDGQEVAVWQVAEYAVGHHQGSANPGEGSNIVLAGHVGGYGKVFLDLFAAAPGDEVLLYSQGQQYRYIVHERLLVDEEGVPPAQRAANARFIEPTSSEVLTLVTCWPPSGADRFRQRVIVRALPAGAPPATSAPQPWTLR